MGSGFNTLLAIALTILAIVIISALLYGKDQGLLSRLADKALSVGDWFLPNTAPREMKQDEKLPSKVTQAQNNFIDSIKRAVGKQSTEYCLLNFDLSGLGKYEMLIQGPGITTRIINPKYSYTFGVIPKKEGEVLLNPVGFDNAEIYVFNSKNYKFCFERIGRLNELEECKPENICYPSELLISQGNIKYKNNIDKLADFMMKLPNTNRFCFIPTQTSFGNVCDATDNTINVNCLEDIKKKFSSCI